MARRLLEGDRLYVDVMDFNPPLIFCMMTIPAWLAVETVVTLFAAAGGAETRA